MGCANATHEKPRAATSQTHRGSFHEGHVITGKLGAGSYAQVYAVSPVNGAEHMAVKITDLRASSAGRGGGGIDALSRRMVEREASFLSMMANSPHVVRMKEGYLEGIFAYIVMERCDLTLFQALARAPELTEKQLQPIVSKMLEALVAIHKVGIVHRDIKPENFMCTSECCTVKLCDFGLAVAVTMPGSTCLRGVAGTAPFMSPEMIITERYDAKTDVWSLGVIAYVLLYGEFPYQPARRSAPAMKAAIMSGSPAPGFKPRDGLGDGSGTISYSAAKSVQALLLRMPEGRPSAKEAGALPWFALRAQETEWPGSQSLTPMLYSAKEQGAFGTSDVRGSTMNSVDGMLLTLQARAHGTARWGPSVPPAVPGGDGMASI